MLHDVQKGAAEPRAPRVSEELPARFVPTADVLPVAGCAAGLASVLRKLLRRLSGLHRRTGTPAQQCTRR